MLRWPHIFIFLLLVWGIAGCFRKEDEVDYVARVGTDVLLESELEALLEGIPLTEDTLQSRQQVIEQWVNNALLYQEALRRDLRRDSIVQQLLRENERSVLVSAVVEELIDENIEPPSLTDLVSYYERNKPRLALREPFVRIRYFSARSSSVTEEARTVLAALSSDASGDSLWDDFLRAAETKAGFELAGRYVSERRLFMGQPVLRSILNELTPGAVSPVVESDSLSVVLQLVDRVSAGTEPEFEWVEEEIRRRLVIEARKQMYARQVQSLRNRALAQDELEIR